MKCKYMKSAEFKARQAWLDFVDVVGIALQIMAEVKENSAAWLKKWVKNFRMPLAKGVAPVQEALELVIGTNILKWADWTPAKNYELELKPIETKKDEKPLTWKQLEKWSKENAEIANETERDLEIHKWIIEKNKRVNQDIEDSFRKPCRQ